MPMTSDQYVAAMDILTATCRTLSLLPIPSMLEDLGQMETLGPILEPTAYQRGGGANLRDQRELLEAAQQVQLAVNNIAIRHGLYQAQT